MATPTWLTAKRHFRARLRACFAIAFLAAAAAPVGLAAQETDVAPLRTSEFAAAVREAAWQELEPGLWVLKAQADAATLTAFRIADANFSLEVAAQAELKGEFVEAIGARAGAVIAVNGGFFGESENNGALYPVGLLRVARRNLGQEWQNIGGYLAMAFDRTEIRPTRLGSPNSPFVIQSKPVLIEPGGVWAMNTNNGLARPRTLVCRRNGETLIVLAHGIGLSLFEAGWLMRGPDLGGAFACDSALALDGGGSTQLWVAGREDLAIAGETRVHNALIVRRK